MRAVTRPSKRFVPIKNEEQQAALAVHRTRALLIGQRTQLINALRAHLAELGLVAEQGRDGLAKLVEIVSDEENVTSLPAAMRVALQVVLDQLEALRQPWRSGVMRFLPRTIAACLSSSII